MIETTTFASRAAQSSHRSFPPMSLRGRSRPAAPMSTTERLAQLETAQEVIGMMIALRSEWIAAELLKDVPDSALVHEWSAERARLVAEEDALAITDSKGLEDVLARYAREVRKAYQR